MNCTCIVQGKEKGNFWHFEKGHGFFASPESAYVVKGPINKPLCTGVDTVYFERTLSVKNSQ